MKLPFKEQWCSMGPRQQLGWAVLTVVLGGFSCAWFLDLANRNRSQLRESVSALRIQNADFENRSAELERLRGISPVSPSQSELRALVEAQTNAIGLTSGQVRIDSPDKNHVKIEFGAVPFSEWVVWLENLQSQQVRVESSRIEALSATGFVSATSTLVRSKSQ